MNRIAIVLSLTTLAVVFVVGWAPGPGVRDLGGGFTTDTSTANTLKFLLNGTEFARFTSGGLVTPRYAAGTPGTQALPTDAGGVAAGYANWLPKASAPTAVTTGTQTYANSGATPSFNLAGASGISPGIVTPKLALGAVGSALPTYNGCVKSYANFDAGTVYVLDETGCTGTPDSSDMFFRYGASYKWAGDGGITTPWTVTSGYYGASVTAPAIFPKGINISGSAAPTAPTTGVQLYATLDATPKLTLVGASGITPSLKLPGALLMVESAAPGTPAGNSLAIWADTTSDDAIVKFDDASTYTFATHP